MDGSVNKTQQRERERERHTLDYSLWTKHAQNDPKDALNKYKEKLNNSESCTIALTQVASDNFTVNQPTPNML